jgi:hypothetical protein
LGRGLAALRWVAGLAGLAELPGTAVVEQAVASTTITSNPTAPGMM